YQKRAIYGALKLPRDFIVIAPDFRVIRRARCIKYANDIPERSSKFDFVADLCVLESFRYRAANHKLAQTRPEHPAFSDFDFRTELKRFIRNTSNDDICSISTDSRLIDKRDHLPGNTGDALGRLDDRLQITIKETIGLCL